MDDPDPELELESVLVPRRSSEPPPGPELLPDPPWSSVLVPPLDVVVPLLDPEDFGWSSPFRSFSDFFESSSSAFGFALPCATGTATGVAAIVLAELN